MRPAPQRYHEPESSPRQLPLLLTLIRNRVAPHPPADQAFHQIESSFRLVATIDPSIVASAGLFSCCLESIAQLQPDHQIITVTSPIEALDSRFLGQPSLSADLEAVHARGYLRGFLHDGGMRVVNGKGDRQSFVRECSEAWERGDVPFVIGERIDCGFAGLELAREVHADAMIIVCSTLYPPESKQLLRVSSSLPDAVPGQTPAERWIEEAPSHELRMRLGAAAHAAREGIVTALISGGKPESLVAACRGEVDGTIVCR